MNNFTKTLRNLSAGFVLLAGGNAFAQTTQGKVGINNSNPQATLDVTAKTPAAGSAEGTLLFSRIFFRLLEIAYLRGFYNFNKEKPTNPKASKLRVC